ncbi:helix-turn-helix domain-containing protein [Amycolatopsis sp. NPDC098790]|uniref:helix-turn-helix domain-containing protein n=1 Tax=Amycolatopsis sp. NPDC098790 TaxID=3363939 RepID=UPI003804E4B3
MDIIVRQAVARAITTMQDNLGDRLTIDDLARAAMFSKFHFTRIFLRATGLSPGRFLSALRLAEAKRLLVTTGISVADISHQVGYNSVGTFSARFSGSVGHSPSAYRQLRGRCPEIAERAEEPASEASLRGHVRCTRGADCGPVFLGLFPAKITEGHPGRHAILSGPGTYALTDVPTGCWYVIAHAFGSLAEERVARPFVGVSGPVTVGRGVSGGVVDVGLRPRHGFDPPVLLAIPDLRESVTRRAIAV